MTDDFVYIGSRPKKAWANFHWANIASSTTAVSKLLDNLDGRTRTFLVVSERTGWRWLLENVASSKRPQRHWRSRVLALVDIEHLWAVESLLESRFERCVRRPPVMLRLEELVEVLKQRNRADFCIGGSVDRQHHRVVLLRGDLDVVPVPMAIFKRTGDGFEPNFDDFEVIDHGQNLRFGSYEASFDAVLYEVDEDYRRRLKKQRRRDEQTFGASLRRLRAQRGLSRNDFLPDVSAKSIARIERGEVDKPHASTVSKIARRIGVSVAELETY